MDTKIQNNSMIGILSGTFPVRDKNKNFSAIILIFSILLCALFIFNIAAFLLDLFAVEDRILVNIITLAISVLFFYLLFLRENRGDFFSSISIILFWYFLFFVISSFIVLLLPEVVNKINFWNWKFVANKINFWNWEISDVEYAVWMVTLSLYALCFGYKIAGNLGANIAFSLGLRPSRRRIVFYVCLAIVFSFLLNAIRAFLIQSDISAANENVNAWRGFQMGKYTLISFLQAFFSYIFYMCFIFPRDDNKNKMLVWCANIFIIYTIVSGIIDGFHQLKKTVIFNNLLFVAGFLHYTKRKIKALELFLLSVVGIALIVIVNYLRAKLAGYGQPIDHTTALLFFLHSIEAFEHLCMSISYFPQSHDYYYGQRLFEEVFYLLIPRAFWAEKPIAYGSRAILYDINPALFFSGYHTGLPAQFYADFGFIGVITGFAVFGVMIKALYNIFKKNMHNAGIVIIYLVIVNQSWLFLMGGFPWLNVLIIDVVPLFIVFKYVYPAHSAISNRL